MIKIRNWDRFQHYKHRNPPWIRLHRDLLVNQEFMALSGDAARLLMLCWILAAEHDGELPDVDKIAWRLRMTENAVRKLIPELDHWLEHDASTMLAPRYQDATPETETETDTDTDTDTETESARQARAIRDQEFKSVFWPKYPNHVGKPVALKAWHKAREKAELDVIMAGLRRYIAGKPPDRPWCNPSTWLNQERWADEPAEVKANGKATGVAHVTRAFPRWVDVQFDYKAKYGADAMRRYSEDLDAATGGTKH